MRNLIRSIVDKTLKPAGLTLRRRHDSEQLICSMRFATVIDGGANEGGYAAKIRAAMPEAEIHAFEPNAALHEGLTKRFAGDAKVSCYDRALNEASGPVTFHITDDDTASSLLEEAGGASAAKAVTVQAVALDDWAKGRSFARPALLKLDVEGNELAALRGAAKLLEQMDYVELETTFAKVRKGQPEFRELLNFLDERGFTLVDVFPGTLDPATHSSVWADAVFARKTGSV